MHTYALMVVVIGFVAFLIGSIFVERERKRTRAEILRLCSQAEKSIDGVRRAAGSGCVHTKYNGTWRLVAEGEYVRSKYFECTGYVSPDNRHLMRFLTTTVVLADGRSHIFDGHHFLLISRGTRLRLWSDERGDLKIEEL